MISIGKPCVVVLLLFSSATIATPASVRDERVNDGSEGPEVTVISASSEADSQMAKSTNGDFRDPEVLVVMAKEWSEDCRSGGEGLQFCSQDRGVSKAQGWQEGGDDPGGRVKPIQINGRMLVTESWQPQQELVQARPLRVKMAEEVREGKEGKEGKEKTGEEYEEGQRGGEDEDEEDKGYETGEIGGGGEEEEVKGYEEGEKGGGGGEEDEEVGQYEERERQGDKEEKDTNNHNSKYDDYNGNYDKVEEAEAKKKGEDMNEEKIAVTDSDLAEDRTNNPQKNDGMDEDEDDDDDDDDEITNEGEQYEERNQKKPEEEAEMTMEEAWKQMKHEADPIEEINSELVEYKLQNIMDYYNPLQKGRNEQEQTSSMSLWQYMVNYVTNGWDNTPPEENVVVDQTKEHNPCKGVPGDYNIWTKTAQPMEVVVVGGGVAGLAALKTLNDLKVKNIVLLEATNRLGGRVKTIRHSSWVVNEGPDAIQGGEANPLYQIAQEVGALGNSKPNKMLGSSIVTSQGKKVPLMTVEKHANIAQQLSYDLSMEELSNYYGRSLGDFYSDRYKTLWGAEGEEDNKEASMYIHHQEMSNKFGFNSWFNMSARDADNFVHLGEDYTWQGGMDSLIHYLMDKVPQHQVRMLSPVCKVFWDLPGEGSVLVVTADGSSYLTEYLIITIPLAVLRERHFETFVPTFPKALSNAFRATTTGTVNRLSLGWALSWWGNSPLNLQIFWKDYFFPPEMEWVSSIVHVRSVPHHPSQLEMTVTGEASLVMEKLDPATVISHLITFLRTINRESVVPIPLFFHRSRWCRNIWARSSYQSYMSMTGVARYLQDRSALNPKITNALGKQSLFFGGEHTSTDRFGTVDGAMLSGVRAAKWVVDEPLARTKQKPRKGGGVKRYSLQNNSAVNYFDFFKNPEKFYQQNTNPLGRKYTGVKSDRKKNSKEERKLKKQERKRIRQRRKQVKLYQQPLKNQFVKIPEVMYQDDGGLVTYVPSDSSLNQGSQSITTLPLDNMHGKYNFSVYGSDNSKIEVFYVGEDNNKVQAEEDLSSHLSTLIEGIKKGDAATEGNNRSVASYENVIEDLIDRLNEQIEPPQKLRKSQKKKLSNRERIDKKRKNNKKGNKRGRKKNNKENKKKNEEETISQRPPAHDTGVSSPKYPLYIDPSSLSHYHTLVLDPNSHLRIHSSELLHHLHPKSGSKLQKVGAADLINVDGINEYALPNVYLSTERLSSQQEHSGISSFTDYQTLGSNPIVASKLKTASGSQLSQVPLISNQHISVIHPFPSQLSSLLKDTNTGMHSLTNQQTPNQHNPEINVQSSQLSSPFHTTPNQQNFHTHSSSNQQTQGTHMNFPQNSGRPLYTTLSGGNTGNNNIYSQQNPSLNMPSTSTSDIRGQTSGSVMQHKQQHLGHPLSDSQISGVFYGKINTNNQWPKEENPSQTFASTSDKTVPHLNEQFHAVLSSTNQPNTGTSHGSHSSLSSHQAQGVITPNNISPVNNENSEYQSQVPSTEGRPNKIQLDKKDNRNKTKNTKIRPKLPSLPRINRNRQNNAKKRKKRRRFKQGRGGKQPKKVKNNYSQVRDITADHPLYLAQILGKPIQVSKEHTQRDDIIDTTTIKSPPEQKSKEEDEENGDKLQDNRDTHIPQQNYLNFPSLQTYSHLPVVYPLPYLGSFINNYSSTLLVPPQRIELRDNLQGTNDPEALDDDTEQETSPSSKAKNLFSMNSPKQEEKVAVEDVINTDRLSQLPQGFKNKSQRGYTWEELTTVQSISEQQEKDPPLDKSFPDVDKQEKD